MQFAVFMLVLNLNLVPSPHSSIVHSPNRNKTKRKFTLIIAACHSDNRRRWTTGGFIENEWEMLHFCHSVGFKSRLSNHKNSQQKQEANK